MQRFYNFIKDLELPNKIKNAFFLFSKREWLLFFVFFVLLFISSVGILYKINEFFLEEIPAKGGLIKEGIMGSPRFINPLLASSDADKDMVALIYNGLMRKDKNGLLILDLAKDYEISEDGLEYTFYLEEKAKFHNGNHITADDVIFTIQAIKDPENKSPYKASWDGVNIEKINENTIKFILKQPYSSFLNTTTLGIMPKELWEGSPIELNNKNIEPIGGGPYKIKKFTKENSGIIKSYELESNKKFIKGEPFVKNIILRFYPNEEELIKGLQNGEINQAGYLSPKNIENFENKNYNITSVSLPRVFGLFFNQNQNQIFINLNIRQAIDYAIDKERIINEVLFGYGTLIEGPIPKNLQTNENYKKQTLNKEERIQKAEELLKKEGWNKNDEGLLEKKTTEGRTTKTENLTFTISTSNTDDLTKTANLIKEDLEKIGFKIEIKNFEIGNLNQLIIKQRKYDALLFGQIITHPSDLYAFWHSSQRKDPGLNVSIYTNSRVDKLLEEAYTEKNKETRDIKYKEIEAEIQKEFPAVFLYSPNFIYLASKEIKNNIINNIIVTQDRFSEINKWHIKAEKVWKIFTK